MAKDTWVGNYYLTSSGKMAKDEGVLEHYLKKNTLTNVVTRVPAATEGAKRAELHYRELEYKGAYTLIEVRLMTGRGHQIRVQLATEGHPIVGDMRYGDGAIRTNLALWAAELKFTHPVTKERMVFIAYPPEENKPWSAFAIERHLAIVK